MKENPNCLSLMFPWRAVTSTSLLNLLASNPVRSQRPEKDISKHAAPTFANDTTGDGIPENRLGCNCGLALANVFTTKQKLPVQITDVDGIQIHDLDLFEARQDQDLRSVPKHDAEPVTRSALAVEHRRAGRGCQMMARAGTDTQGSAAHLEKLASDTSSTHHKNAGVGNCGRKRQSRNQRGRAAACKPKQRAGRAGKEAAAQGDRHDRC
jgi:hypothetical protein